jgi:hypothetical protein
MTEERWNECTNHHEHEWEEQVATLKAEVERLKAHTWQQERAASTGRKEERMKNCPNPECSGSEDSLEIVEDERCTRNRCCWVHCDWCGVAGPTAGPSDESAIEAWDRLPRITEENYTALVDCASGKACRREAMKDIMTPEDVLFVPGATTSHNLVATVQGRAKSKGNSYASKAGSHNEKLTEELLGEISYAYAEGWVNAIASLRLAMADHYNKDKRGKLVLHGTFQELMEVRESVKKSNVGIAIEIGLNEDGEP